MGYTNAAAGFPSGAMPGEPVTSSVPRATGGRAQPRTHGKKIKVKAHTRVVKPKPPKAPATTPNTSASDAKLLAAATRLKFGDAEQGLTQQLNQNQRYTSGLHDWYGNATAEIAALRAQGQQTGQNILAQTQNYNTQPVLNNPTDQQAALARSSLNSQYAAQLGRDSNAQGAFFDRLAGAQTISEGNARNAANAQRMGLLGQQTALKGQEGDFATTYGAQIQASAQKAAMDAANLAVKQGTLAYLTGNAQSLATHRKNQDKTSRSNVRLKGQSQSETKHQNAVQNQLDKNKQAEKAYLDAHPELKGKGKGANKGPTRPQKTKAQEYLDSAQAKIRTVHGSKPFDPNKEADLLSTSKHAIPRDLALAAGQLVKNQKLGIDGIDDPKLAKRIFRLYGIRVKVVKQSPQIGGVVKGLLENVAGG